MQAQASPVVNAGKRLTHGSYTFSRYIFSHHQVLVNGGMLALWKLRVRVNTSIVHTLSNVMRYIYIFFIFFCELALNKPILTKLVTSRAWNRDTISILCHKAAPLSSGNYHAIGQWKSVVITAERARARRV